MTSKIIIKIKLNKKKPIQSINSLPTIGRLKPSKRA